MTHPIAPTPRARQTRLASLTVGVMLGMVAGAYLPQVAHAAAPSTAATAKPAAPSAKKSTKKTKSVSRRKKAVAAKIAETQLTPLPEASAEQVAAADRVLIGKYECEFNKNLLVDRNDKNLGYINMTLGKQTWVTKPVLSSTGAIRLEDTESEALLLQILTKSMVMNIKTGQRIADGCVHEVQRAAEAALAKAPRAAGLFGTPDAAPTPGAAINP